MNSIHLWSLDYWAFIWILVDGGGGFLLFFSSQNQTNFMNCLGFWMTRDPHSGISAFYFVTLFSRIILLNWLNTVIIHWLFLENSLSCWELYHPSRPSPLHFYPTHKLDSPTVLSQFFPAKKNLCWSSLWRQSNRVIIN